MAEITELLSLDDYNAELSKPGFVVVDFYSTQCPPCKASQALVSTYPSAHLASAIHGSWRGSC